MVDPARARLAIWIAAGISTVALILITVFSPATGSTSLSLSIDRVTGSSSVKLIVAGTTFLYPELSIWIQEFEKEHPSIEIEYVPSGSVECQKLLLKRASDLCISILPLEKSVWDRYRGEIMQVPYALGAIVVVYNIPEIGSAQLNLTGEVLAKVYRGDIVYWDDPEIKKLNPAVAERLPHREIVVVYRGTPSGAQLAFTAFLHRVAPSLWPAELVSELPKFPVEDKRPSKVMVCRDDGEALQIVMNTPYSISFVEWSYALKAGIPYARIANTNGSFVTPTVHSLKTVAKYLVGSLPRDPRDDFSDSLNKIARISSSDTYPLTTWSYLILWTRYPPEKTHALIQFLKWIAINAEKQLTSGYTSPELLELLNKAVQILGNNK